MDPTVLGPVSGILAMSLEMAVDAAMEPVADMIYNMMMSALGLGL